MPKNKKHITQEDFQRYLENQMTDTERNLFERELQKQSFEAEALEGMQQFSPDDIQSDINNLSEKISTTSKRRNSRFWAAAATIILLVSVGVIWFQIKDNSPTPEMAQTKSVQESSEKIIPESPSRETQKEAQPIIEKEENAQPALNEILEIPEPVTKSAAPKSPEVIINEPDVQQAKVISEDDRIQPLQQEETVVNEFTASEQATDTQIQIQDVSPVSKSRVVKAAQLVQTEKVSRINDTNLNIVKGQVISLGDSMPLPGVSIVQKGTSNGTVSDLDGNFTLKLTETNDSILIASFIGMENTEFFPPADSTILVGLEPSQVALEEVVITGYGSQKNSPLTQNISASENYEIKPKIGMEKFKEYINENAILPEDYASNRVAVRAQIKINPQGKIISVENKNDADAEWFNKAKDLILNGPDWNPKTINGTPVESEVTIRIVFKK